MIDVDVFGLGIQWPVFQAALADTLLNAYKALDEFQAFYIPDLPL